MSNTLSNTITVNGVEYTEASAITKDPSPVQIVVAQRGWVIVGRTEKIGDELVITDASVIRTWGTTKGLGQLALEGPQASTTLDPAGTCRVRIGAEVLVLDCDESKWSL